MKFLSLQVVPVKWEKNIIEISFLLEVYHLPFIYSVNGVPACVNKKLLTGVLRDAWNFTGFVISDSGALEFIILNHRYIKNIQDTAVACASAGVNLELHAGNFARGVFDWLKKAVDAGQISQVL